MDSLITSDILSSVDTALRGIVPDPKSIRVVEEDRSLRGDKGRSSDAFLFRILSQDTERLPPDLVRIRTNAYGLLVYSGALHEGKIPIRVTTFAQLPAQLEGAKDVESTGGFWSDIVQPTLVVLGAGLIVALFFLIRS